MTAARTGVEAPEPAVEHEPAAGLRRALLIVAGVIIVGTVAELAMQRHWTKPTQFVAWGSLLALAVGIGLVARPTPGRLRVARIIVLVVAVAALFGMWEHIEGNYDAGPLDAVYGEQWDGMSEASRWWVSFIQSVGPSPALAPGVLVIASLCIWFAARRHPVDDAH